MFAASIFIGVRAFADEAEVGKRVYRAACAACHGERGDGKGVGARDLDPPARDFTKGVYKFRSTATGSLPLVDDVVRTVTRGVPGTDMPGWTEHLSPAEIRAVAQRVIAFAPVPETPPERIVPADLKVPPPTPALVERGRAQYEKLGCPECHGKTGRGDGPARKTLKDDDGRPMQALDFTGGTFRGGDTPIDVYRAIATGAGGTPMPSYADAVPDDTDRWSLVYFVRSLVEPPSIWRRIFGRQTNWR